MTSLLNRLISILAGVAFVSVGGLVETKVRVPFFIENRFVVDSSPAIKSKFLQVPLLNLFGKEDNKTWGIYNVITGLWSDHAESLDLRIAGVAFRQIRSFNFPARWSFKQTKIIGDDDMVSWRVSAVLNTQPKAQEL